MTSYARAELEEAKTALTSTFHKCEKIDEGKKLGKSQQTLLGRIPFDGYMEKHTQGIKMSLSFHYEEG